jgi:uncharacterized protein YjbI with pentapeptide repeats
VPDERAADQTATTTTINQGQPDTSEPTPERQAQLRAAYEANVAANRGRISGVAGYPPYWGVVIGTLGEVQWVLRERDWSIEPPLPGGRQLPDLGGVHLDGVDLSGADFSDVNLGGAHLNGANLRGAFLSNANLGGAFLSDTDLSGARLIRSNLGGAFLNDADLRGADLDHANLSEAHLSNADLRGANLYFADLSGSI